MLSDRYQRFSKTGIAKAGDSSRAITSGKVISQESHYPYISLDADLVQRALDAYRICRRQLLDNAIASVTG
jgi:hypothetical protein